MNPREHDIVIIGKRLRGVVIETRNGMAFVYTPRKDCDSVHQQWYENGQLKVISRWRSLLVGDEPDDIKIIER